MAVGVFIDQTVSTYTVLLVGIDGKVAAQAHAARPAAYGFTHFPAAPPLVSITRSRVYYADGDSIKYLRTDGSIGVVMPYPGGPQTVAGFSISSDDKRIAVALLTLRSDGTEASLKLFVQDLTGGNRVELFSSTSVSEWPVAWTTDGRLVIAVGPAVVGNSSSNPYNSFEGYHVVDAATGNRLVTMTSDCIFGPVQPTGTACNSGTSVMAQAFDGTMRVFNRSAGDQFLLELSPDGSRIAGRPGALGSPIVLYNSTGTVTTTAQSGVPMGWIDNQHLVYFGPSAFERHILDLSSSSTVPLPACACGNPGIFFGALESASE